MTKEHDDSRRSALQRLTDATGLIIAYPEAVSDRMLVLQTLAARIAPRQVYTEHELNALIQQHVHEHAADHVTVRRDLIDYQFIQRTENGARYWRIEGAEGVAPNIQVGKGTVGAPHVSDET